MGGKRLDKNRMRMRALLFEIQDVVDVVNGRNNVDICGIDILPTGFEKSWECYIHSPVKNGFCFFNLIIPTELSEFVALNPFKLS